MSHRNDHSAGILAFRHSPSLQLLLAHPGGPYWRNRDAGAWTIPKGQIESGDALTCAKREFTEETGLTASGPFILLTPVRQEAGKTVHAFAIEADFDLAGFHSNEFEMEWPLHSGNRARFPEIDKIAYFSLPTARKKILPSQQPLIEELVKKLRQP